MNALMTRGVKSLVLMVSVSLCVAWLSGREVPAKRSLVVHRQGTSDSAGPAPASWRDLVVKSTAVVMVRLTAYSTLTVTWPHSPKPISLPYTKFAASVLEVLKDNRANPIGPDMEILRRGGITVTPAANVKRAPADEPDWLLGQNYVFFLGYDGDPLNGYRVLYQADGTLHVKANGKVDTGGRTRFVHTQHGRDASSVLDEIRSAIRSSGG